MLDQQQRRLMYSVRHVSKNISHNLRILQHTPIVLKDVIAEALEFCESVTGESGSTLTARFDAKPVIKGDRELM